MIITIRPKLLIHGIEQEVFMDFDTDGWRFEAIIINGREFSYTEHESQILWIFGGKEFLIHRYIEPATSIMSELRRGTS